METRNVTQSKGKGRKKERKKGRGKKNGLVFFVRGKLNSTCDYFFFLFSFLGVFLGSGRLGWLGFAFQVGNRSVFQLKRRF
jgi:hypothetical protein